MSRVGLCGYGWMQLKLQEYHKLVKMTIELNQIRKINYKACSCRCVHHLYVHVRERTGEEGECKHQAASESQKEKELAFSPRTTDKPFGRKGFANDCIPC